MVLTSESLNENDLHGLIYLDVWFPVDELFRKD